MSLFGSEALAVNEPVIRYDHSSVMHGMYPATMSSNALYLNATDSGPEQITRLDLRTLLLKKIVGADPDADKIVAIAARGNTLAYVKRSLVRAPRGYRERSIDRLFISDGMGRDRELLHREVYLQQEGLSLKSTSCGQEIDSVQLLPGRKVQIVAAEFGLRSHKSRCRRVAHKNIHARQRLKVIRFTLSGKRVFTRRLRIKGDLRFYDSSFSVSGNGRYLLSPERDRIRVVDIYTGRKRFKSLSGHSGMHDVIAGFDRSALVIAETSGSGDSSTNEYRYYRDIVSSDNFKRFGLVKGKFYSQPFRCGKRLFMTRTEGDDVIRQIGGAGTRVFATLPADEDFDQAVCDEKRMILYSYAPKTEETLIRLLPFRRVG